jgi:dihydrofolate reductase
MRRSARPLRSEILPQSITIIAAMGRNRAIGLRGRMPWHLPAELQHFKKTTMGKPVVMGRKTWESIGRPLPGRKNVVVTRTADYEAPGCEIAASLKAALEVLRDSEVMIIGGGELYRQVLPLAQRMVLTLVDCAPEADTWFPSWDESQWRVELEQRFTADEHNAFDFKIRELIRISA